MKSMLKAPGTKRLKLTCDGLLSSFAFKFKLRRYTQEIALEASRLVQVHYEMLPAGRATYYLPRHIG
jgi:hypothetical protein